MGKVFHGWRIVGASFFMLFFTAGAQYAFGVMFKPIIGDLGWSRSAVSLVFMVNMVVYALALTVAGRLYDRFGPRWIIIVSTLLISAGFVLTSAIHSIGQFFFSYGILAALGLAGTGIPFVSTLVSKWFDRKRGLAVSLSLTGGSMGAFILVPLLSLLSVTCGWRASFLSLGVAMLVANMLIAAFVIKGDPRHLGVSPLGAGAGIQGGAAPRTDTTGLGLREALATRSYWLFLFTMFICGSGDFFATTHFINMATDYGVSPFAAGKMMGWYGLFSFAGVLAAGPVADRIGSKTPIVLTFALRLALYLFIFRYKSFFSLYVFALLFGFTHLITAPLAPVLVSRLYGLRHLGLLTGVINTVHFLGGGVFTYIVGLMFDRSGSYQTAFLISAGMAAVAVLCSSFIVERQQAATAHA